MFQILTDAAATEGSMIASFLPLVLIIVFFYFFLIRPQRKRDKETQQMRNSIEVGDEIVTIGGIIGTVVSIREDMLVIETAVIIAAVAVAAVIAVTAAVIITALACEGYVVRDNLYHIAVGAVLCLIGSGLQLTLDGNHRALAEIAAYKLSLVSPADDINKVCLALLACLDIAAVYGDAEAGDTESRACGLEFGVRHESAHQYNTIYHFFVLS